jgi:2-polyprenyl-6-methoxyphenol hydroxylase-like FAD-dependent oxidoreductase
MRVACVGGGPAGLFFASLVKADNPGHEVTVIDRGSPSATYGWGVVFGEALLGDVHRADPVLGRRLAEAAVRWTDQHVCLPSAAPVHLGGYGYSIRRRTLLELLTQRAQELGVRVEHHREIESADELPDADLVVAADGVRSRLRQEASDHFQPSLNVGANTYIWLGTRRLFDAFTFGFEQTAAGWIWFHAYRFDDSTSTFIAECAPQTWRGLGFDAMGASASAATLERIFARHLDGHALLPGAADPDRSSDQAAWLSFTEVKNRRWDHGRVVLMGDAAHTAHFSIGSGTTLAMDDGLALAAALREGLPLPQTLALYQARRMPDVVALQREAANSAAWFENLEQHVAGDPVDVGFSMLRRRFASLAPGEHRPQWRYRVLQATQRPALRVLRNQVVSARRALQSTGR